MPTRKAESNSTKTFLWSPAIIACTRFDSKEAIPRAIHIVSRNLDYGRFFAMAGFIRAGRLSRPQSRHGLAIRGGAWIAGTKARCRTPRASGHRARSCALRWNDCRGRSARSNQCATRGPEIRHRNDLVCVWIVSVVPFAPSELGWNASRLSRFDALVIDHGFGARRGIDVTATFHQSTIQPEALCQSDCQRPEH